VFISLLPLTPSFLITSNHEDLALAKGAKPFSEGLMLVIFGSTSGKSFSSKVVIVLSSQ